MNSSQPLVSGQATKSSMFISVQPSAVDLQQLKGKYNEPTLNWVIGERVKCLRVAAKGTILINRNKQADNGH